MHRIQSAEMDSTLTNVQLVIALVIAINVAVLALRLCVALYRA